MASAVTPSIRAWGPLPEMPPLGQPRTMPSRMVTLLREPRLMPSKAPETPVSVKPRRSTETSSALITSPDLAETPLTLPVR